MREGNTQGTMGYIQLPAGTTAQRPSSPVAGMMRWNTTLSGWDHYDGSGWDTRSTASLTGADGQVSEPMEFRYDPVRAKYLSTGSQNWFFLAQTVANDDYINWAGTFSTDFGNVMPYNGTVVGFSVSLTDVNLVARSVSVYVAGVENTLQFVIGTAQSDGVYSATKTNSNLNFSAGNKIAVRMRYSAGTSSRQWTGLNLIMLTKWRL